MTERKKRITILGATGSVGQTAIRYIKRHPDLYCVDTLSAHQNIDLLIKLAKSVDARCVAVSDEGARSRLESAFSGKKVKILCGRDAVIEAARRPTDWVIAAIVGVAGLMPIWAALEKGYHIALANKEALVCAGDFFMSLAKQSGSRIFPIDSEHSGIAQILGQSGHRADILNYILTGSGGPFRTFSLEEMKRVKIEDALNHPVWKMGKKISIDSASLMNKGLELIEAHHLLSIPADQLSVLIHPEGVIHAMIELKDGSTIAHMSLADMSIPIAYALSAPYHMDTGLKSVNLAQLKSLNFEPPDFERFRCYALAKEVLEKEIQLAPVLNAANEEAVFAFLKQKISFLKIANIVEKSLDQAMNRLHTYLSVKSIEEIMNIDQISRMIAKEMIAKTGL